LLFNGLTRAGFLILQVIFILRELAEFASLQETGDRRQKTLLVTLVHHMAKQQRVKLCNFVPKGVEGPEKGPR
jgi:hypothetical protein